MIIRVLRHHKAFHNIVLPKKKARTSSLVKDELLPPLHPNPLQQETLYPIQLTCTCWCIMPIISYRSWGPRSSFIHLGLEPIRTRRGNWQGGPPHSSAHGVGYDFPYNNHTKLLVFNSQKLPNPLQFDSRERERERENEWDYDTLYIDPKTLMLIMYNF